MRDWVKLLLITAVGASIALVVTLPIVLTNDKVETAPNDPGAQRFPESNFVKFSDLYNDTLKTKNFKETFSVVDPDYYLCTVDTTGDYFKRKWSEYVIGNEDYDKCDGSESIQITGENFKNFRKEMIQCSISSDELFLFCYKDIGYII